MLAALFILYVVYHCWRHPEAAPLVAEEMRSMPIKQKLATLRELIMPLCIAGGVLGSIYAGYATPSEAAGVGVVAALISAVINKKLSWTMVRDSLYETLRISCMLAWLFFGAQTVIGAYTLAGGTTFVTNSIKALDLGPIEKFPFLDPPDTGAIKDGYETLFELGALDAPTALGAVVSELLTVSFSSKSDVPVPVDSSVPEFVKLVTGEEPIRTPPRYML